MPGLAEVTTPACCVRRHRRRPRRRLARRAAASLRRSAGRTRRATGRFSRWARRRWRSTSRRRSPLDLGPEQATHRCGHPRQLRAGRGAARAHRCVAGDRRVRRNAAHRRRRRHGVAADRCRPSLSLRTGIDRASSSADHPGSVGTAAHLLRSIRSTARPQTSGRRRTIANEWMERGGVGAGPRPPTRRCARPLPLGTIVALRRKLDQLPAAESARLAGLGHLYAGRQVASAITRVWWPLAVLLAVFVRRTRLPLAAAATVPALLDWFERRGPARPGSVHRAAHRRRCRLRNRGVERCDRAERQSARWRRSSRIGRGELAADVVALLAHGLRGSDPTASAG